MNFDDVRLHMGLCRCGRLGGCCLRSDLERRIQRIDLSPGDRLFDPGEVIVEQFLSLRAGDVLRPQLTDAMAISAAINARAVVAAYLYSLMVMAGSCRRIPIGEAMLIPGFALMNAHQPSVLYQSSSGYPR